MKNIFKNNKCVGIRIILLLVIILLLFVILAVLVFNNRLNVNIDLGSLIGGITGGLLAVFGVIFTIRHYNKSNSLAIRPYFSLAYKNIVKNELFYSKYDTHLILGLGAQVYHRPIRGSEEPSEYYELEITNCGGDSALEINFLIGNKILTKDIHIYNNCAIEKNGSRKILIHCFFDKLNKPILEEIKNTLTITAWDVNLKKQYKQTGEINLLWIDEEVVHFELIQLSKPQLF